VDPVSQESGLFVGRESELRLLKDLIAEVSEGTGGAVWVQGVPGIGKSALIAAALNGPAADGADGCLVYAGAASEQSPLFPLQLALDVLGGGISFAVPQEREPESVRTGRAEIADLLYSGIRADPYAPTAVTTMVAERLVDLVHRLCAVAPLILVVDDVQWADRASVEILMRLAGLLRQLPLLVVIAARPVPAPAEVAALHRALTEAGGQTIELGPVSDGTAAEMTRRLIGGMPGPALTKQLAAAVGHPFYLRELIDALIRESRLQLDDRTVELRGDPSDLPSSLPAAIGARLGFLSEPAMSALRVGAVLGPSFSVADLSTVSGQRASDLVGLVAEAVQAGVLTETVQGLAFRHDLIHHTLYHGIMASLRTAMHRQAAEQLARAGARPEQVAVQLLSAPGEVAPWMIDWMTDAAPMLSLRAPQVSADLLSRVRVGLAQQDHRRPLLDAELATARLMLGENEEVVRLARPLLSFTLDPVMAGRIAWTLAYALPRLGRVAESIEVTDEVLARSDLPALWSARLRARRSMSLYAVGRYDEAYADAERAVADGEAVGDQLAIGYALYTVAYVEIYGRRNVAAAKSAIERAVAMLADDPGATDLVLLLLASLGGTLLGLGLPEAADAVFAQVAGLADRGTEPRQAVLRVLSAAAALYRGRWDDALAEMETAERLPLDAAYRKYLPGIAAQVAVHRDDRAAADASLRGAEDVRLIDTEVRMLIEFLLVARAIAAERDARPAEALTRFAAAFDPDGTGEFPRLGIISTQWLPDVVRLALATGKPDVAAGAARACARDAAKQGRPTPLASAQHCQGLLDGDPDAVRAAAAAFEKLGYPLLRAQALENAAVLYAERGKTANARAAYLAAIDIYGELGAAWDIMRADSRLRTYGVRRGVRGTRRQPASGWDGLTLTEQKIARLVAEGLSNPDIAAQLFVSRNTVQTHVARILSKLDARSRSQITHAMPAS
jgi:DNA-binding CsgD family transcriptional regulator